MISKHFQYLTWSSASLCALAAVVGCDAMTNPQNPPVITDTPAEQQIELEQGSATHSLEEETNGVAKRLESIDNGPAPTVPAASQLEYTGVVSEIQPTVVRIRYGENKEEKFALAEDVVVVQEGSDSDETPSLSSIQVGQQVVLIVERKDDQNDGVIQVVKTVQIMPAPTPEPAPATPEATPSAPETTPQPTPSAEPTTPQPEPTPTPPPAETPNE